MVPHFTQSKTQSLHLLKRPYVIFFPLPLKTHCLLIFNTFSLLQPNWPLCCPTNAAGMIATFILAMLTAWNAQLPKIHKINFMYFLKCHLFKGSTKISYLIFLRCPSSPTSYPPLFSILFVSQELLSYNFLYSIYYLWPPVTQVQ